MRFIVLDGLDGVGKDTHAKLIQKKYLECGEVILRSHPTDDNYYGKRAKKALLGRGKVNKIIAAIFYALDVIRSVRMYYGKADTVIFVRYLLGVVYLPYPLDRLFYKFFETILPVSEYMFFLDLTPEKTIQRLSGREDREMFENMDDIIKIRKKAINSVEKWHIIPTDRSVDDVQIKIDNILNILDQNKIKP